MCLVIYHVCGTRIRLCAREAGLVEDCLSRLVGVVVLKLHTVCTDSMLATISSTCSHLASLDIRWLQTIDIDMNIY